MRNVVIVPTVLAIIFLFTAPTAPADSTEYGVSINVTWSNLDLLAGNSDLCGSTCNQIRLSFSSDFTVNTDGSVVPGSMIFWISEFGDSFSFDTTPPSYPTSDTFNSPFTAGSPYNWSNDHGDVITFLPPGCSYVAPSTCGGGSWLPGNSPLTSSTVNINSFIDPDLFSCWAEACPEGPSGPDNPADGGSIVISPFSVPTPEPSSALLLALGAIFLANFGIWMRRPRLS
jgi:hypothetical protein